ncbi:hypothetical protein [Xanthomonas campestris]|uniref:hypothetical protein n=1 Tax=Xanthomonas cannabis TaxID=1885674 RepID=UPI001E3A03B0|nr:hypothetical protein [Xanthomonas campestris pv. zinniae]
MSKAVSKYECPETRAILAELHRLDREISCLRDAGRRLGAASQPEIEPFQRRVVLLKAQLKAYAKHGTADPHRKIQTSAEQAWFGSHVRNASSRFRMKNNAGPRNWEKGLSESGMDISYALSRLPKELNGPIG